MQNKRRYLTAFILAGLAATATVGLANNICVTNISLTDSDTGYTHVQCDVSWDGSWRAARTEGSTTVTNWDAAWVFVKFRVSPGGAWQHASLSTNKADYVVPAGVSLDVGLTGSKGMGVFLYRSAEGGGSWTNTVKLRWNYKQDGIARTDPVDVSVHAFEMVYVPQGSFYLGDGIPYGEIFGNFESATNGTAFLVTNDYYAITLGGGSSGSLGNNNNTGMQDGGLDDFNDTNTTSKILPAAFPKGFNAFYCMKYEVSQGQYAEFLNQLTSTQATARYQNKYGMYRYAITNKAGVFVAEAPDRACNYFSWPDSAAYSDWAGLRPMTELEFEKACRGPLAPVVIEYVWGNSTTITDITNFLGAADGDGKETAAPANANCNYGNNGILGPVRCGIFATPGSGRVASGATYWGIMDMGGNVAERAVTVGTAAGRAFTGTHGDGKLDTNGNGDVTSWLGTSALMAGWRGGLWQEGADSARTSKRRNVNSYPGQQTQTGWRAVRSSP